MKINEQDFTFCEYASSVSQRAKPATPCSNQKRRASCWKIFARLRRSEPAGKVSNTTKTRGMCFKCTEVERLDDLSAFPVTFTSQMSNTTFRPVGTKSIHLIIRVLLEICVPHLLVTNLVALCEQMLDLSYTGLELVSRGEVKRRESVVKHALQDQSPCTQGLKAG